MWRVAGICLLVLGAAPAWAWPATVQWPTYYRSGPDKQYGVLDELQRGQTFEVLSCDGDWCRVRGSSSVGYIERGALAEASRPLAVDKPGDCIDVRLAGHTVKGQPFRFCEQAGG